jgi:hypothetical protein
MSEEKVVRERERKEVECVDAYISEYTHTHTHTNTHTKQVRK